MEWARAKRIDIANPSVERGFGKRTSKLSAKVPEDVNEADGRGVTLNIQEDSEHSG